jgi:hypothetical protein
MATGMLRAVAIFFLPLAFAPSGLGSAWEAIHMEMREALAALSQEYFGSPAARIPASAPPAAVPQSAGRPYLILVGFTGGVEPSSSKASGVVVLHSRVDGHFGSDSEVRVLTYNNFRWRRAATDVVELVLAARRKDPYLRQPLIVVYGHSWGGGSIRKFAGELQKEDLEISLAIYIDTFQWRNPRLPENIRYAVNFYQRAGLLRGLPLRGKSKLIPGSPDATHVLGNYRITPQTDFWGWNWNLIQPLLYRHHHRIAHDVRLQRYLVEIVHLKMELLNRWNAPEAAAASPGLFDRVVILGASVSAGEKAPSPGLLLARHLGTPEEKIFTFAEGGAESEQHLGLLDNISRLRPTLVVALDLFYHDFKSSVFLSESRKAYLREYIARLHDTGAVIVLGSIPNQVLLRHEHVNRYLQALAPDFPRLVLVDVRAWIDRAEREGIEVTYAGQTRVLKKEELFADRVHPNLLGNTLAANLILDRLRGAFPERAADFAPLPLPGDEDPSTVP